MFDQTIFNPDKELYKTQFKPDVFWIKNLGLGSHMLIDGATPDQTISFDDDAPAVVHPGGNILNNKESDVKKSLIIAMNYSKRFMSKSAYIGNGKLSTIDHDLKTDPEFVMFKNVTNPGDWISWHYTFSSKGYLKLNSDDAFISNNRMFGDKIHNKIKLYADGELSIKGNNYVAYSFAFSKYFCSGFYLGQTQSTVVTTRNKPDMVIIKRIDQPGSWRLFSRLFTPNDSLRLNSFGGLTENDDLLQIDFSDNGFSIPKPSYALNNSNGKYIYLCFTQDV